MTRVEAGDWLRLPAAAAQVPLLGLSVEASPEAVTLLRRTLMAFAVTHGAEGKVLADIRIGVTEAAANVVAHAYGPEESGPIHLAADVEDGALEVVIADDGTGLRPGESEGLGLGLGLIAEAAADFAISERATPGTEVWMRFLLDEAP